MISRKQIADLVKGYDDITIGVLGSHSALEVMDGAKDEGMSTVVVCQKGRDTPYKRFSRLADKIIVLDKFSDMLHRDTQNKLNELKTILVPHRALTAYLGYDSIENDLMIPIFGSRSMLRAEERTVKRNQYHLLEKARVRHPKIFKKSEKIDRAVIVKVQDAKRKMERAFFIASSYKDYKQKVDQRIKSGKIRKQDLSSAVIEEFVIGTYFNFNFFYSPLKKEVEFLGIERRLQTNLNDFVTIPAKQQLDMDVQLQNIEVGHTPASIRESMLEKVFEIGDRFVKATKSEYPPGIIGPLSLQSIVTVDMDIVVYDVSLRVPGNPIMATTSPYTKYYYGKTFGVGRRIAMEIKSAYMEGRLADIVT
ncbi:MAG: formate--phosphoribosylaminoimidazolecarboxamide ligase family protein [Nitrososphaerales archaeon]